MSFMLFCARFSLHKNGGDFARRGTLYIDKCSRYPRFNIIKHVWFVQSTETLSYDNSNSRVAQDQMIGSLALDSHFLVRLLLERDLNTQRKSLTLTSFVIMT